MTSDRVRQSSAEATAVLMNALATPIRDVPAVSFNNRHHAERLIQSAFEAVYAHTEAVWKQLQAEKAKSREASQ